MSGQGLGLGKRSQQEKDNSCRIKHSYFDLMSFDDDELEEVTRLSHGERKGGYSYFE